MAALSLWGRASGPDRWGCSPAVPSRVYVKHPFHLVLTQDLIESPGLWPEKQKKREKNEMVLH